MKVFIDTSAFLAILAADDKYHPQAKTFDPHFAEQGFKCIYFQNL